MNLINPHLSPYPNWHGGLHHLPVIHKNCDHLCVYVNHPRSGEQHIQLPINNETSHQSVHIEALRLQMKLSRDHGLWRNLYQLSKDQQSIVMELEDESTAPGVVTSNPQLVRFDVNRLQRVLDAGIWFAKSRIENGPIYAWCKCVNESCRSIYAGTSVYMEDYLATNEGVGVIHINNDTLNNRDDNIQSLPQPVHKQRKRSRSSTTGVTGVSCDRDKHRFLVKYPTIKGQKSVSKSFTYRANDPDSEAEMLEKAKQYRQEFDFKQQNPLMYPSPAVTSTSSNTTTKPIEDVSIVHAICDTNIPMDWQGGISQVQIHSNCNHFCVFHEHLPACHKRFHFIDTTTRESALEEARQYARQFSDHHQLWINQYRKYVDENETYMEMNVQHQELLYVPPKAFYQYLYGFAVNTNELDKHETKHVQKKCFRETRCVVKLSPCDIITIDDATFTHQDTTTIIVRFDQDRLKDILSAGKS
jgi:hypothetical protein